MSTTISMWLGIAFVALGIAAVLMQAWLWNPKYWDEVNKRTRAPKAGLLIHRWIGIAFTVIYVVMMWEMIPRLWEYQVELPARTVMHAVAAIVLGILLLTKLAILRFFRHFEESMPALGYGTLVCTLVLGTLSIPFAMRAAGFGSDYFDEANVARVRTLLSRVEFKEEVDVDGLTSEDGFTRGRQVLVGPCVRCHDMRTILAKPRGAQSWYKVVDRMTEKPSVFGEPIEQADVPYVTAYLVAITPEIQESRKLEAEQKRKRGQMVANLVDKLSGEDEEPAAAGATPTPAVVAPTPGADDAGGEGGEPAAAPPEPVAVPEPATPKPAAAVDTSKGPELLEQYCVDCHEMDEVEDLGGATLERWIEIVTDMVVEEGAEIPEDAATVISHYLAKEYPAG